MAPQDFSDVPGVAAAPEQQMSQAPNMSIDPNTSAPQPNVPSPAPQVQDTSVPGVPAGHPTVQTDMGIPLDPNDILNDPNASRDDKLHAMGLLKNQEHENDIRQNAAELAKKAQHLNSLEKYQNDLKATEEFNMEAPRRGVAPVPKPTLKQYGLDDQTVAELAQQDVQQEVKPAADALKQQDELNKTKKDAEFAEKQRQALVDGHTKAADDKVRNDREAMDAAAKSVADEQAKLTQIDPTNFWKNQSTGTKIVAGIAVAFGGSNGIKDNPGLAMMNKAIDDDVAARKVNNEQALALKANGIKRAMMEIDRFSALSQDRFRRQQAELAKQQLAQQLKDTGDQLVQQKLIQDKITKGIGLTSDELSFTASPEQQKKAIQLPNGNYTFAPNEKIAEEFNKSYPDLLNLSQYAQEREALAQNLSYGTRLTPKQLSQTKSRIAQLDVEIIPLMKSLNSGAGQQRLNNDVFTKMQDEVLGYPATLWAPEVAKQKAHGATDMIYTIIANKYRAAGAKIKDSDEHLARLKLLNQGNSLEASNAIIHRVVKKAGK
jgi:hypothetical protein